MRDDLDPSIAEIRDIDSVAEIARAAIDFDALLEESSECRGIEDAVLGRLICVDDVLRIPMSASTSSQSL